MEHFTPVSAAVGGALIGLSAAILWIGDGRIAGISGVVGAVIARAGDEAGWRWAFLAGLVAAPLAYLSVRGAPEVVIGAGLVPLVIAGLLVGYGTRLGSGCTSGHGVCGLARLSKRSVLATMVFMLAAGATVYVTHHVIGAS